MQEIAICGFNCMVLSNTEGWKECLEYLFRNMKESEDLVNKMLEKVIKLNRK